MVSYKNKYICFILVNGHGTIRHKDEPEGFCIWSDDSDSSNAQWYEKALLEVVTKEIAIKNIDFCAKCNPNNHCFKGMRKLSLGKNLIMFAVRHFALITQMFK